ncbi:MAG TPA: tRNA uridine-5-carboxymethylaminomethyl(34) synthesis GTPase MnmE [Thermoanaerobaculia bacterium]|nr:tRNA uridine-5-carboxymethylaminomethyl(34) synthesis GTPase MnmE [Thermoanaerobaculia bacterium]
MRPTDSFLDTIAAPATPAGRSALALVRLSGPESSRILAALAPGLSAPPPERRPRRATLVDRGGTPIDDAVVTFFPAGSSPTGEDVVELSLHGSPVAVARLLEAARESGARPARPGEFTERAFRAGRMDLVRAEAVRDLIEARTGAAAEASARRLTGALSDRLQRIRRDLLDVSARLAAAIDFSDDVGGALDAAAAGPLREAVAELEGLAATAKAGRLLSSGCRVAILGRPNAGKSTLYNALVGEEKAIVTEIPGTTRDALEAEIDLGGIPVTLVDTAGLRATAERVEAIGVERARAEAARADAVLYVFDAAEGFLAEDAESLALAADRPVLLVANKADRLAEGAAGLREGAVLVCGLSPDAGPVLARRLSETIAGGVDTEASAEVLGNLRQADLVARARTASADALAALEGGTPLEYAVTHCHAALDALADLVGETTSEDVLERLFSTFCVGK